MEAFITKNRVRLEIKFDGQTYELEVNPENLVIQRGANNSDIDIIGLGPATRKGHPGLISMEIKSFFPSPLSPFHKYDRIPEDYINFIYKIWETENINNKVAKLVTHGLDINFSMWFVINNFNYEYRGGETDIYYTLNIKEYVPYGVSKISESFMAGMGEGRAVSENAEDGSTNESKTYVVASGDTLWGITKRCTGNGNNWRELYELNKDIIGTNPNYIKVGTTLVLPDGWNSPAKVNNNTSSKKKSSTVTSTPGKESASTAAKADALKQTTDILNSATKADSYIPQYLQVVQTSDSKAADTEQFYYMKRRDVDKDLLTDIQRRANLRALTSSELQEAQYLYNSVKSYDTALSKGYTDVVLNKDGTIKSYKTANGAGRSF